jgi:hypothetical protein
LGAAVRHVCMHYHTRGIVVPIVVGVETNGIEKVAPRCACSAKKSGQNQKDNCFGCASQKFHRATLYWFALFKMIFWNLRE